MKTSSWHICSFLRSCFVFLLCSSLFLFVFPCLSNVVKTNGFLKVLEARSDKHAAAYNVIKALGFYSKTALEVQQQMEINVSGMRVSRLLWVPSSLAWRLWRARAEWRARPRTRACVCAHRRDMRAHAPRALFNSREVP